MINRIEFGEDFKMARMMKLISGHYEVSRKFSVSNRKFWKNTIDFTCATCNTDVTRSTIRPTADMSNALFLGSICSNCRTLNIFCDKYGNMISWSGRLGASNDPDYEKMAEEAPEDSDIVETKLATEEDTDEAIAEVESNNEAKVIDEPAVDSDEEVVIEETIVDAASKEKATNV